MGLSEEAKAELAAAVKILREDGVHIHKTYAQFLKAQQSDTPETTDKEPTVNTPVEGGPPPVKEEPTDKPKKKSLWWGEQE